MSLPAWLEPMAATSSHHGVHGREWTFERKLDGIRVLAYKDGREVSLWSRNRLPLTERYPAVVHALASMPVSQAIFDGEATGAWGRQGRADYHVFDLLWFDGRLLTGDTLDERRAALDRLRFPAPVARVPLLTVADPWSHACQAGWEGVIAKRRDSLYEHRRSKAWLKLKCDASQELVVGGFTDPQGRRVGFGALLVGYFEGQEFVFAVKIGTGFDAALLTSLHARLRAIEVPAPPFTKGVGLSRLRAHWVRPEIVVQVAFTEWTPYDKLRHPRLLGLRDDKAARDVVRERP